MYAEQREIWLELLQMYKEMSFLWDPKHKDYSNQFVRNDGHVKLFEVYKKLDSRGTIEDMKKKIVNFRATYSKERKKKQQYMENGKDYTPTLWYYDHLTFLTDEGTPIIKTFIQKTETPVRDDVTPVYKFNRSDNKIYLEKGTPSARSLKRKRAILNSTRSSLQNKNEKSMKLEDKSLQSSDDEETLETVSRRASTNQLNNLIEKQTKLIDNVSRILNRKDENWQVVGKSIGLQLNNLEEKQRMIANKLISDVIFQGAMGRLTMESFINVDSYGQNTPESNDNLKEHIEYLESDSPEYLENE